MWGAKTVPGGFDSHALPPLFTQLEMPGLKYQIQIKTIEDELKHAVGIKITNRSMDLLNKWGVKYNADPKHHDRVAAIMLPKIAQFYNDVKNKKIDENLNPEWLKEMEPDKNNINEYVLSFMEKMYKHTITSVTNADKIQQGLKSIAKNSPDIALKIVNSITKFTDQSAEKLNKISKKYNNKLAKSN